MKRSVLVWYLKNKRGDSSDSGPVSGSGILLEDGVSFLLMETGDYLLLES